LYVYVFELVRSEQQSLDIVQESFINAARYIRNLREDAKFGSWLFGIAHQKCVQHWRRNAREEAALQEVSEWPADLEDGPDDLLLRQEQEAEFMMFLDRLPPPHRSVLLLHYVEEFSLEQIASITQTELGTVKSRLYYARKALRKILEEKK
jgi:RNA polymerase sigma-70 factor (ECF subfamily)